MNYDKKIMSFDEAIEYLDVSKSMLYKLTSARKIKFYKPNNGKIYFKVEDLDEWMLKNEYPSVENERKLEGLI